MTAELLMFRKFVLFVSVLCALHADFDYTISNTNFTISQGASLPFENREYIYNYDRFRFRGDYVQEKFYGSVIADAVNYLGHDFIQSTGYTLIKNQESDTPFKTQTSYSNYHEGEAYAKLYRAYAGYEDEENRVTFGLQNITMGVGRIWTPSNLFNPRNTYAFEPDEVYGVAALNYTRYIDDTSHLTAVVSQKKDKSYKYAARYKGFLEFADIAVNTIYSDNTRMIAYELEGNLADTGVELRSEGAYIKSEFKTSLIQKEDKEFFQGIVGADYGFENGLTLTGEALYSSESFSYEELLLNLDSEISSNLNFSKFYMGTTLNYSVNIFLDASLVYIESFNEHNSRFISPTLSYTLNDYNTFVLGALIHAGPSGSEFGSFGNSYYLKYLLSF